MKGIGKTTRGSIKALDYIKDDKGKAEFLCTNMLLTTSSKEQYREMKENQEKNKFIQNPFYNVVLSASPNEKLSNDEWINLVDKFAEKMKLNRNQFIAYKHASTDVEHVHIIFNRVDETGKNMVKSHNILQQTHKAVESIAKQMGYIQSEKVRDEKIKKIKNIIEKDAPEHIEESLSEIGYSIKWNFRNSNLKGARIQPKDSKNKGYKLSEITKMKAVELLRKIKEALLMKAQIQIKKVEQPIARDIDRENFNHVRAMADPPELEQEEEQTEEKHPEPTRTRGFKR